MKIELLNDPPIPCLRLRRRELKPVCWRPICTPYSLQYYLLQPRYRNNSSSTSSTDKWITKMWCTYTMKSYLSIKRMKFCDNMDESRGYYAKWNKPGSWSKAVSSYLYERLECREVWVRKGKILVKGHKVSVRQEK
jgi:hypothetical protein